MRDDTCITCSLHQAFFDENGFPDGGGGPDGCICHHEDDSYHIHNCTFDFVEHGEEKGCPYHKPENSHA